MENHEVQGQIRGDGESDMFIFGVVLLSKLIAGIYTFTAGAKGG